MCLWPVLPNYIVSQGQGLYLSCPLTLPSTDQRLAHWVKDQRVGLAGSRLRFITCCVTLNKLHNLAGLPLSYLQNEDDNGPFLVWLLTLRSVLDVAKRSGSAARRWCY